MAFGTRWIVVVETWLVHWVITRLLSNKSNVLGNNCAFASYKEPDHSGFLCSLVIFFNIDFKVSQFQSDR